MRAIIWYTKVVEEEIEVANDAVAINEDGLPDLTEAGMERIEGYIKGELDDAFCDDIQGQLCRVSIPKADYFCEF